MGEDFYVGYEPSMPSPLANGIRRVVAGLLVLAAGLAVMLAAVQTKSANARFHYFNITSFEGRLIETPYPGLETVTDGDSRWYWLVAGGKHGAAGLVKGLDGRRVRIAGTLIERDGERMIEILPTAITTLASADQIAPPLHIVGPRQVEGEIVDSKCHLGVMKPGEGPTHRDCAVRCLLGGIPPLLIVRNGLDVARIALIGPDHQALNAWRQLTGRPVRIRGALLARGRQQFLAASVSDIDRLESRPSQLWGLLARLTSTPRD